MPARNTQGSVDRSATTEGALTTEGDRDAITALSIPEDVKADLLRQQGESIQTPQALPRIKIMAAGAGMYDIQDDATPVREFSGVVLASHARNVLWDRPYGEDAPSDDEKPPACSSTDGIWGTPREGFRHPGLVDGQVGNGVLMVACRGCPLNQFGSGNALIATHNPKGKACANQKSVYVLLEGHETPFELRLPAMSIRSFDAYLTGLLNRGVPVQAVVTRFRQEVKMRGTKRYGEAIFEVGSTLSSDAFQGVLVKRSRYSAQLNPQNAQETSVELEPLEGSEEGDIPF